MSSEHNVIPMQAAFIPISKPMHAHEAIMRVGQVCHRLGKPMTYDALVDTLNSWGVVCPSSGQPYQKGKRGIAAAITSTWHQVGQQFGAQAADDWIARSFVDATGEYAYSK